jgi:carboxyl-terminal processing protease
MMSEPGVVWWLGQHLLITTALAAIVLLVTRLVRLNPAARHVLWLLVLCRLMVPPVTTWPWSVPITIPSLGPPAIAAPALRAVDADVTGTDGTSTAAVVSMSDAIRVPDERDFRHASAVGYSPIVADGIEGDTSAAPWGLGNWNVASIRLHREWIIAGIWGIGSVIVAVTLITRMRRVGRFLNDRSDVDTWLKADVAEWCGRLAIRAPACVVTEQVRSPFLWCVGRIRLVWPQSESHPEHRERARPILVHELAHLKRRDHWTAWVELIALIVWWWNPVFWLVRRPLRAAAEMSCDAWVVELLPDQRRAYAESLIEFTSRGRMPQLAVGATTGSRRTFARRLEMIMNEDSATRFSKWTGFSAVLLAVLSLPVFAIEPETQSDDAANKPAQVVASDDAAISRLVAQFNKLIDAGRLAEAAIVARNAAELDPDAAATKALVEKSRLAGQLTGDDSDSQSSAASRNSSTTTKQRFLELARKRVVYSARQAGAKTANASASLDEILGRIEKQYYGRLDRGELERAAIEAIMSKLDDKSSLLTREQYEQMTVAGDRVGVGIAIHLDSETGQPVVTRPIRNSPGLAAGIRRDDIILSVDGESTDGLSLKGLIDRIRGPRDSTVTLGIQRAAEKLDVKVVRERFETFLVNPWSVSADGRENYWADRDAGIGYVHIPAFTKHTVSQLRNVLADLSDDEMKALVLDLRDCGGGLLTAATEVVDMFIDEGVILSSQGRSTDESMTFRATKGGKYIDLPVAVLINGYTASAAEIVAAALQDHHRAAMVGEQTFGRGTVQSLFPLKDGGALKLTTAAWLRPNGRTLLRREGRDDWGVQPDTGLAVVLAEEAHKQLAEQRRILLNGENVDNPIDDPQLAKAAALLQPKSH